MDDQRFDSFTRLFASTLSRRNALKTLAAAVGTVLVGRRIAVEAAVACDTQACLHQAHELFKVCTDGCNSAFCRGADRDPKDCVSCQTGCLTAYGLQRESCREDGCSQGTTCMGGICCAGSQQNCNGQCVDASCSGEQVYNPATCQCECPAGTEACFEGCAPFCPRCFPACPSPQVRDPESCECQCAVSCPPPQSPNPDNGCACECPATSCPPGETQDPTTCQCACGGSSCADTCCDGACVDTSTDPANCGGCGVICSGGGTCQSGSCACPTGTQDCSGGCENSLTDPNNCGSCGAACPAGYSCFGFSGPHSLTPICCATPDYYSCYTTATCPSGYTACGGICHNDGGCG